jgi:predicted acyl esterase
MSDQEHGESFDFDPSKPQPAFSEPSYEGSINEYKEALELLKDQYALVEKKLVEKEEEMEHLLEVVASSKGGKDTHNFELINETFELKS